MPSRNHSRAAQNLAVALAPFRDRWEAFHQLSLNLDGWESIPDLCLYPAGSLPHDWAADEDVVTRPPALVIEILSPKQNLQPLLDKVRTYHSHGVKSCWVVIPGAETVSVFPANGGSRSFAEGEIVDAALDIRIPVAAVFA